MGWRRFAYDFFVIQIGFLLIGLSVDIMVQADLGLSPWDVLHMGLTYHLPISLGESIIGVGFTIVLLDVVLGERVGWGTIMNMLFIGFWVDALRPFVPIVPAVLFSGCMAGFCNASHGVRDCNICRSGCWRGASG